MSTRVVGSRRSAGSPLRHDLSAARLLESGTSSGPLCAPSAVRAPASPSSLAHPPPALVMAFRSSTTTATRTRTISSTSTRTKSGTKTKAKPRASTSSAMRKLVSSSSNDESDDPSSSSSLDGKPRRGRAGSSDDSDFGDDMREAADREKQARANKDEQARLRRERKKYTDKGKPVPTELKAAIKKSRTSRGSADPRIKDDVAAVMANAAAERRTSTGKGRRRRGSSAGDSSDAHAKATRPTLKRSAKRKALQERDGIKIQGADSSDPDADDGASSPSHSLVSVMHIGHAADSRLSQQSSTLRGAAPTSRTTPTRSRSTSRASGSTARIRTSCRRGASSSSSSTTRSCACSVRPPRSPLLSAHLMR